MSWATAFVLTQATELPVYWWGTRDAALSPAWRLAIGLGASAVTHPVVWFVLRGWLSPWLGFAAFFLIAETFALGNERFGRPSNPDHLLRPGELLEAVRGRLRVLAYEDLIVDRPRPAAVQRLCARNEAPRQTGVS